MVIHADPLAEEQLRHSEVSHDIKKKSELEASVPEHAMEPLRSVGQSPPA